MFAVCEPLFARCDLFIAAAAVADYRPKAMAREKLGKRGLKLRLELVQTIDILQTLAARKRAGQVVVGFAAETHNLEIRARRKLMAKRLDWIVANNVSQPGLGMESDNNAVLLLSKEGGRVAFGPAPKPAVAEFILGRVWPVSKV
jgi:phosphopantothenoylcysteine decarboxylase/phosphopantothenate--cysteine ligase